ncbi:MAG: glycosyltransferase [Chitinophagales bacterium]|nr:glycosyltransferase [Chitinophagales bacterium]
MRVLILGDLNSVHIIRWVSSLCEKDLQIGLFSFSKINHNHYNSFNNLTIESVEINEDFFKSEEGSLAKLKYLTALPKLRKFIKEFHPDILHAHYASSYGLLGALTNFSPYIISVWGSDVYDFPNKNFVFKNLIKFNLKQADYILSTSHAMAKETKKYTNKPIEITPFGVNLSLFRPIDIKKDNSKIILGTVKSLEKKYGIDILIKAFAIVYKTNENKNIELRIFGKGTLSDELKKLAKTENVENQVKFMGFIDNNLIPQELNKFDIYLALSRLESFGAAIVEAEACGVPVIVSNIGGLPEVIGNNETGIIVESENIEETANAILKLISNEKLRFEMGNNGRKRAKDLYDWNKNVNQMYSIYYRIISLKQTTSV